MKNKVVFSLIFTIFTVLTACSSQSPEEKTISEVKDTLKSQCTEAMDLAKQIKSLDTPTESLHAVCECHVDGLTSQFSSEELDSFVLKNSPSASFQKVSAEELEKCLSARGLSDLLK